MFDLTGKTALVTGASGGIGSAVARALHAQGATVAISGTRREALDALAGELGERVHVLTANLSDRDSVEALVPAAEAAMGQLDILVNNAGVTRDNLFLRMKDEEWDQVIRREPRGRLSPDARGLQGHDAPPIRPHRLDHVGRRHDRQCRAGQLCRLEGRAGRHDASRSPPRLRAATSPPIASRRGSSRPR